MTIIHFVCVILINPFSNEQRTVTKAVDFFKYKSENALLKNYISY